MIILRAEQGRLPELVPALEGAATGGEGSLTVECFRVWVYADVGEHEKARAQLAHVVRELLPAIPDFPSWDAQCAVLAHVCATLGAREHAARIYELLAPLRGRVLLRGQIACHGPASYYLGILAATLGHDTEARTLLAEAIATSEELGSRPCRARAQFAQAELFQRSADASQRRLAAKLARGSLATAKELGMLGLAAASRALCEEIRGPRARAG
jgi:hypothetical protein